MNLMDATKWTDEEEKKVEDEVVSKESEKKNTGKKKKDSFLHNVIYLDFLIRAFKVVQSTTVNANPAKVPKCLTGILYLYPCMPCAPCMPAIAKFNAQHCPIYVVSETRCSALYGFEFD